MEKTALVILKEKEYLDLLSYTNTIITVNKETVLVNIPNIQKYTDTSFLKDLNLSDAHMGTFNLILSNQISSKKYILPVVHIGSVGNYRLCSNKHR